MNRRPILSMTIVAMRDGLMDGGTVVVAGWIVSGDWQLKKESTIRKAFSIQSWSTLTPKRLQNNNSV